MFLGRVANGAPCDCSSLLLLVPLHASLAALRIIIHDVSHLGGTLTALWLRTTASLARDLALASRAGRGTPGPLALVCKAVRGVVAVFSVQSVLYSCA